MKILDLSNGTVLWEIINMLPNFVRTYLQKDGNQPLFWRISAHLFVRCAQTWKHLHYLTGLSKYKHVAYISSTFCDLY